MHIDRDRKLDFKDVLIRPKRSAPRARVKPAPPAAPPR